MAIFIISICVILLPLVWYKIRNIRKQKEKDNKLPFGFKKYVKGQDLEIEPGSLFIFKDGTKRKANTMSDIFDIHDNEDDILYYCE